MKNKLYEFIRDNREQIVEALGNHISEIQSLTEGADDDLYIVLNGKRNRLLKRLKTAIEKHSYQQKTNPYGK